MKPELTPLEKQVFSEMLDTLSAHMANAGCNDLSLPNNEESKALILDAAKWLSEERYTDKTYYEDTANNLKRQQEDNYLYATDWMMLAYLRGKLGLNSK